jgi:hypothetical protein
MKIVLRDRNTRDYYAGPDQWAKDASGAVDFQYFEEAIRTARDQGLSNVQFLVQPNVPPQGGEWAFVC